MAGIYIHVPFCKQKCSYCDFHFSTTYHVYKTRMLESMLIELKERKNYLQEEPIETIYFGGGTPSLLDKEELEQFLVLIKAIYQVNETVEITLEANPDDMTLEKLEGWKEIGFNRLSVGLQSFREEDLKWMNRAHNAEEALTCVHLAEQVGFKNISVDLIYGLPNLTPDVWMNHIQKVLALPVQHISAYCLTIEEKTSLHKWVEQKKITPSNNEEQSVQFETLVTTLQKNNFEQYEISNFSKNGCSSKHNSNYWKGVKYVGIGPSAHSFDQLSRSWNISNNQKYMQLIEQNETWWETEELTLANRFNEALLIGLRTTNGVNIVSLKELMEFSPSFLKKIQEFKAEGWLKEENDHFILTVDGRLKADYIAAELFV